MLCEQPRRHPGGTRRTFRGGMQELVERCECVVSALPPASKGLEGSQHHKKTGSIVASERSRSSTPGNFQTT